MIRLSGQAVAEDCKNTSFAGDENHLVAGIGLKDIMVIHTKSATIVAPINRPQLIKQFIAKNLVNRLSKDEIDLIIRGINSNAIDI
jgi:hypothetical protein